MISKLPICTSLPFNIEHVDSKTLLAMLVDTSTSRVIAFIFAVGCQISLLDPAFDGVSNLVIQSVSSEQAFDLVVGLTLRLKLDIVLSIVPSIAPNISHEVSLHPSLSPYERRLLERRRLLS